MLFLYVFPGILNIDPDAGVVEADPVQIHEVLMNLCVNAHQAMAEKGGVLEVRLENVEVVEEMLAELPELHPGPHVLLSVRDSGCGMEPGVMKRIFEPYFTTKDKDKGTGLGLAVVLGIVQKHQGAVVVESDKGRGSLFRIYLPVLENAEESATPEPEEETVHTGHERILLVEDEPPILELEKRKLEELGYTVFCQRDGLAALDYFHEHSGEIDLVITDMTMPEMTGAELTRRILAERPDMPIILCTGYHENISPERAAELGARALVMKPLPWKKFGGIIRRALEQGRPAENQISPSSLKDK